MTDQDRQKDGQGLALRNGGILLLALWLFVSPWLMGFADIGPAAGNAWGMAVLVAALVGWAFRRRLLRLQAALLLLGFWLILAPWVMDFAAVPQPVYWNFALVGLAILLLALGNLLAQRGRLA